MDPIAMTEIDARLASYGFDQHTITTEVYMQAREMFVLFGLIREIRNQRIAGIPIRQQL